VPSLPSWQRVENPPPIQLTNRDKQIILAVYRYRFINAQQIEALLFPPDQEKGRSRKQACQRRLQRLFHHGFVTRIPLPIVLGAGRAPYVYALDEHGADIVAVELGIDRPNVAWTPSDNQVKPLFLDHVQAINTVRVVVERLRVCRGVTVVRWLNEGALQAKEMKDKLPYRMHGARMTRIIPDAYFALAVSPDAPAAHFFLELDQGTMSNSRWRDKILAYLHFRQSGRSEKYFATRNFRMLTVTTSIRRLENLKRTTEKAQGGQHFWFTTKDQISLWNPESLLTLGWHVAGYEQLHPLFA
jgi:hypothetical protein